MIGIGLLYYFSLDLGEALSAAYCLSTKEWRDMETIRAIDSRPMSSRS